MSPPDQPSEEDDGLLTASEAAQLELNADIVILSACNTAAGDGKSGGALSGLARAFLYAGSRSLLVSHWYVNSDAAVELVIGMFAEIGRRPGTGRAEALRRTMADRIRAGGFRAHPSYWAPFVVVGEGGSDGSAAHEAFATRCDAGSRRRRERWIRGQVCARHGRRDRSEVR
jgi:CHAT domain-containing protein